MKPIYIVLAVAIVVVAGLVAHGKGAWPFTQSTVSTPDSVRIQSKTITNTATTTTTTVATSTVTTVPPKTVPPAPVPKSSTGIRGSVTIGPSCPVERNPPDPGCADKPYQTTLVISSTIVGRNGGVLVQTDAQGHFTKDLTPGTYTIRSSGNSVYPTLAPETVTVTSGKWTQVTLQFDSGIR